MAIIARSTGSKTVLEAKEALKRLQTKGRVTLNWVRAHKGTPLNERADRLANAGRTCTKVASKVPMSHVKEIKRKLTRAN